METIKAKLKEYLAMDHELEFGEFNTYYNSVIEELNANYQGYDAETLLTMRYVLSTVAVNAQAWSMRKDKNSKKYRKINDKCMDQSSWGRISASIFSSASSIISLV